jgi:hypothetical protein
MVAGSSSFTLDLNHQALVDAAWLIKDEVRDTLAIP